MWPAGTTREQVAARLAAALARVAGPPTRKLQRDLDRIATIWSPPEHLQASLGGRVHWRIPATAEAILVVGAHHKDPRPGVRRAVMVAMTAATPHVPFAAEAITAGLRDPEPTVRINAARALALHPPWAPLRPHALRALADPLWTVRWHAAVAVSRYGDSATASAILCATRPDAAPWWRDPWLDLAARVVEPTPPLRAAIAERRAAAQKASHRP